MVRAHHRQRRRQDGRFGRYAFRRATAARSLRGTCCLTRGHVLNADDSDDILWQLTEFWAVAFTVPLAEQGIGAYRFCATYDQQQAPGCRFQPRMLLPIVLSTSLVGGTSMSNNDW